MNTLKFTSASSSTIAITISRPSFCRVCQVRQVLVRAQNDDRGRSQDWAEQFRVVRKQLVEERKRLEDKRGATLRKFVESVKDTADSEIQFIKDVLQKDKDKNTSTVESMDGEIVN